MRLHPGSSTSEQKKIEKFSKWFLCVGNGNGHIPTTQNTNFDDDIQIREQYCIDSPTSYVDDIIRNTYDGLEHAYKCKTFVGERAILAPTNQVVDQLNDLIVDKIPEDQVVYYRCDTVQNDDTDQISNQPFPVKYLNSIKVSGLPPHELRLKEGVVVMLMRNLSPTQGLCNGTRLIVQKCMKHTMQCEVLIGNYVGSIHFIPRMDMCPIDSKLPFNFMRKQFPLQLCFAMTINKAQGQSLNKVGLYLPRPVFCHGQLYVTISLVTSPQGLKVYIETRSGGTTNVTKNIVYEEIFYTLPGT